MIKLLKEIEENAIQLRTLGDVFEELMALAECIADPDVATCVDAAIETCFEIASCMVCFSKACRTECIRDYHSVPFFQTLYCSDPMPKPRSTYKQRVQEMRSLCIEYLYLSHKDLLTSDVEREQVLNDLATSDLQGYRLLGEFCIRKENEDKTIYNAAWMPKDENIVLVTRSKKEKEKRDTLIYPYRYDPHWQNSSYN